LREQNCAVQDVQATDAGPHPGNHRRRREEALQPRHSHHAPWAAKSPVLRTRDCSRSAERPAHSSGLEVRTWWVPQPPRLVHASEPHNQVSPLTAHSAQLRPSKIRNAFSRPTRCVGGPRGQARRHSHTV